MDILKWQGLVIDAFGRLPEAVREALENLSASDLEWRPQPKSNSIGWTIWHLIRVQDSEISNLAGKDQLWISESWHEKFGLSADSDNTGYGHTEDEVGAYKSPPPQTYLDYLEAVSNRTKTYLSEASPTELGRELDEPWYSPPPTAGVRIISVLADCHQHAGQALYIRGLLNKKKGGV